MHATRPSAAPVTTKSTPTSTPTTHAADAGHCARMSTASASESRPDTSTDGHVDRWRTWYASTSFDSPLAKNLRNSGAGARGVSGAGVGIRDG